MIWLRSGCSAVWRKAPSAARTPADVPKSMATKFCPMSPVNLTVALLSVRTAVSLLKTRKVTRTWLLVRPTDSTRPISTPAIFTGSPTFSSWMLLKSALSL